MNNNDYKEIYAKTFSKEFEEYCNENISSELRRMRRIIVTVNSLIVFLALFFAGLTALLSIKDGKLPLNSIHIIISQIFFWMSVFMIFNRAYGKNSVIKAKDIITTRILEFIGDFAHSETSDFTYIMSLKIFGNTNNRFIINDTIKGKYKGLPVTISEITEEVKKDEKKEGLHGIFIKFPFESDLTGDVFAIQKNEPEGRFFFDYVFAAFVQNRYENIDTLKIKLEKLYANQYFNDIRKKGKAKFSVEAGNFNIFIPYDKKLLDIKVIDSVENFRETGTNIIRLLSVPDILSN